MKEEIKVHLQLGVAISINANSNLLFKQKLKRNIPLRLGSSFSLPDVSHFLREYLLLGLLVNCKLTYMFIGHDPRE